MVSGRNLNSSKLSCMSSLPARLRMIESKMKELACSQDFCKIAVCCEHSSAFIFDRIFFIFDRLASGELKMDKYWKHIKNVYYIKQTNLCLVKYLVYICNYSKMFFFVFCLSNMRKRTVFWKKRTKTIRHGIKG